MKIFAGFRSANKGLFLALYVSFIVYHQDGDFSLRHQWSAMLHAMSDHDFAEGL